MLYGLFVFVLFWEEFTYDFMGLDRELLVWDFLAIFDEMFVVDIDGFVEMGLSLFLG